MPETVFLAKALGVILIVLSAIIVIRRNTMMVAIRGWTEQRLLRMVIAILEVIGGVFLVVAHNVWSPLPAAVISGIGWLLLIEGIFYVIAPEPLIDGVLKAFNKPPVYLVGGGLAAALGVYLAGFGYSWW